MVCQVLDACNDPGDDVAAMSKRLFFWSITSALAGFLFGFDTVVISGAEQRIQALWSLSPGVHGVALGAALYGTVLGSLSGGLPADKFGRKPTLLWVGVLYIISALGSAVAWNVEIFILARFLGGVGIGISTVVAPMYISEIAPPAYRGRLAGMFQFNIVFGIVVAFLSNALLARIGEEAMAVDARGGCDPISCLHPDVPCHPGEPTLVVDAEG